MTDRALPRWAPPVIVGFIAALAYVPSLANGFALDDVPAVAQDTRIRSLSAIPDLIASPYLTYMPVERSPYRPVTSVSYALSWALGGGRPVVFHAVNVLLHVAATLLVLSLLGALGAGPRTALAAAALFAAHPLHVEAVAGVVGRADVLATLLCLLAARLHLSRGSARPARVGLVALAYLLALGAKESALVLPLLLLLLDALRERLAGSDASTRATAPAGVVRRLLATWPTHAALAAALALFLTARTAVLGGVVQLDIAAYIVALPAGARVTTAVANLAEVARLLVFPLDLSPEYGPGVITPAGLADPRFWSGVATAGLALGLGLFGLRRGTAGAWLALGVAWIAASYALVSNLLLPMPMWLAERTLYLPSVGIAFLVVGAAGLAAARGSGEAAAPRVGLGSVLAGVAVVACTLGTVHSWRRSGAWRDDATLFADLVARHPESFRAQWWLGGRMVDAGDVEGGLAWLRRAVENSPNSVLLTLDYARALLLTGRSEEAEALVRPISPRLHPSRSVFLAQSLIFQGREAEAAEVVREGLAIFPGDPRLTEQARALGIGG